MRNCKKITSNEEDLWVPQINIKSANNIDLKLGDLVEVNDSAWAVHTEDINRFTGKICFECGAFGIGTEDTIPDFFRPKYDNFITLYELFVLFELDQFEDLDQVIWYKGDI